MRTRTGSFPIGWRRGSGEWQQELDRLLEWAKSHELEVIDLLRDGDQHGRTVLDAGLQIGAVDLPEWQGMISADRGKRAEAIARNAAYIRACAAFGPVNHFVVMLPERPDLARADNYHFMVESFSELVPVFEAANARLVIEGYPGPGALCCTPETFRAFFRDVPSKAMGINYDPSHLLRMNIDPLRFLFEFGERVYHIHGKDTQFLTENYYEYGTEQPATFTPRIPFGQFTWRYTIPGHGVMRWSDAFRILQESGYRGTVSIELEDASFHRVPEAEQMGILQGARFLTGC